MEPLKSVHQIPESKDYLIHGSVDKNITNPCDEIKLPRKINFYLFNSFEEEALKVFRLDEIILLKIIRLIVLNNPKYIKSYTPEYLNNIWSIKRYNYHWGTMLPYPTGKYKSVRIKNNSREDGAIYHSLGNEIALTPQGYAYKTSKYQSCSGIKFNKKRRRTDSSPIFYPDIDFFTSDKARLCSFCIGTLYEIIKDCDESDFNNHITQILQFYNSTNEDINKKIQSIIERTATIRGRTLQYVFIYFKTISP